MRYLPHTEQEIRAMLNRIGVRSIDQLFETIPPNQRIEGLNIEKGIDEAQLMRELSELAAENQTSGVRAFLGGGMYDHHIPPAVDQLLLRSEFYTAYTPYQAELSQGTLQATYEFQTMVCQILGTEIANASMYCGASAAAEAVLMARRVTRKNRCVLSQGLHPHYIEAIRGYQSGIDGGETNIDMVGLDSAGTTNGGDLETIIDDNTAAVVVGYPNFLGCVEHLGRLRTLAAARGAFLITTTAEPYALSLIKPPGAFDADVCVGEGQALAVPPQLGGPGVGLFGCKERYVRNMPGRIVGETVDTNQERGFVLTLSTREQHIRRERATSNICTNHGLIALAFAMRTALLGRTGFRAVGRICHSRAEYVKKRIASTPGFSLPYSAPTFNEFVVRAEHGSASDLLAKLEKNQILAGIDLGAYQDDWKQDFLVAVTEKHAKEDLDALVDALRDAS